MRTIRRSPRAEIDLLEICDYIARDNPAAAERQLDRIEYACRVLAENPLAGPVRNDLAPGLRFYPVGNYLIFYEDRGDRLLIVRVLHGARDYRQEFKRGE